MCVVKVYVYGNRHLQNKTSVVYLLNGNLFGIYGNIISILTPKDLIFIVNKKVFFWVFKYKKIMINCFMKSEEYIGNTYLGSWTWTYII